MLLVGSAALKYNFPSLDRDIQDLDFIAFRVEVEPLESLLNPLKVIQGDNIITFLNIQNKTDLYNKYLFMKLLL